MNPSTSLLAFALLAAQLPSPALAAADKAEAAETAKPADPEHAQLVAARKAANDLPEVRAAHEQAKADRALAQKAQTEFKTANKRATESEEGYRKAFEAGLAKVDPHAAALQEKEKAAFKERMLKAREARKDKVAPKHAAHDQPEEPDGAEEA
jgi:hypothetical protein